MMLKTSHTTCRTSEFVWQTDTLLSTIKLKRFQVIQFYSGNQVCVLFRIISPFNNSATDPCGQPPLWFSGQFNVIFSMITGCVHAGHARRQIRPLYQPVITILRQNSDSFIEIYQFIGGKSVVCVHNFAVVKLFGF